MAAGPATVAEVDLSAIVHNYATLMALTPPGTQCMAMVKADAYGHGAVPVGRALAEAGCEYFGVATVPEAQELRQANLTPRIAIMGCVMPHDFDAIIAGDFEPVVSSLRQAEALNAAAERAGKDVAVHIKVDTGMGRVGLEHDSALDATRHICALSHIRVAAVMTHFAVADAEDAAFTRRQIARFERFRELAEAEGLPIPLWHAANSPGICRFPEAHFDMVRPGMALYCRNADEGPEAALDLRQALTFRTRIARIRDVEVGASVSYGRIWTARRPSRIALLSVGYADGLSRSDSNNGDVLVRGRRAPIAGRVCMDLTMVDVTDLPQAEEGDEVVLYGRQGDETITIQEVAGRRNTIAQVVTTALTRRVPRTYA